MNPRSQAAGRSRGWLGSLPLLLLAALCLGMIALPGCGGCWNDDTTASAKKKKEDEEKAKEKQKKKKKAEKPKPDFEPLRARMLPSNDPTAAQRVPDVRGKPGHWMAVAVTAKANNFDFPGELVTFAEQPATQFPLEVEDTTSRLAISRPASLPKGQSRPLPTLIYLPRPKQTNYTNYSLRSELRGARGGRTEEFYTLRSASLKDYEHLIVVLSSNPAAYSHLDKAHSVKMPDVEAFEGEPLHHYYVIRPNVEKSVPLAAYPLAWTTIAYVVWDDINPDVLTEDQHQALLDWVHWGGQLIISGPSSLDKLKGKPLAPYLPGESTEAVKLEQSAFDELNQVFSLQRDPTRAATGGAAPKEEPIRRINILAERPMVGVALKLHPEARPVEGTGGLVVERRVGGGRIVVTRFPLTDVRIRQWKNFDGFLNNVLLRRPARSFSNDEVGLLHVQWAAPEISHMLLEPRISSTLRYFTRDIGFASNQGGGTTTAVTPPVEDPAAAAAAPAGGGMAASGTPVISAPPIGFTPYGSTDVVRERAQTWRIDPGIDDWHFLGYESSVPSGVAAWNDQGAASEAARQSLTEAAGIEIPRADFVMKVLAVYLLVLVPLNWLIFWLIGRVEWAWIAAPLIAVLGAGAVIRLAQLDIGFARSRTEIAILELQGGYDRAHLTRYTALYTSLSSTYSMGFEDQSALALPFAAAKRDPSPFEIQTYTDVFFRRDKEASLSGVKVSSNSTGMVHSEQMYPLAGKLTIVGDEQKGYTLKNTSDLTIRDVGLFRKVQPQAPENGARMAARVETAYVAKIEPQTTVPLVFAPSQGDNVWLAEWNRINVFAPAGSQVAEKDKGRVRLTRLAQLATQQLRLIPGDVRLIGWTDESLAGMEIRPHAPQNATYTLVLAHLVRGSLPPVKPDKNVADDYLQPEIEAEPDPNAPMVEAADPSIANPGTLQLTP